MRLGYKILSGVAVVLLLEAMKEIRRSARGPGQSWDRVVVTLRDIN